MTEEAADRIERQLAVPAQSEMGEHWRAAQLLARSHYFHDGTPNTPLSPEKAFSKILAGHELGFGPIASLRGIYVVKDQVTYSAQIIAAAIQRSDRYRYRVVSLDNEGCVLRFFTRERPGLEWVPLGVSTFNKADQQAAGLSGVNWQHYPRNMMFARALSNGARWYCPDVFMGPIYTPDEMGETVDDDGAVIHIPEAPPMSQAEVKANSERYVQIHGQDDVPDRVQALLIQNAKLQQRAADLHIPGLRQFNAQSVWPVEKIEAANAEVNARIQEREEELDAREALEGQVELPA